MYAFEWSPLGTEFCLVYGFMPAKATLYNMKADPVFEFEPAHRNAVFYNPQGNLVALAGFGNLRGKIEVWDTETRKQVAAGDCPDTTELRWCPDGRHFTVATCAPRLRQVGAPFGHRPHPVRPQPGPEQRTAVLVAD